MPFEIAGNSLSYFPPQPSRGISVRIPESHTLFIGPSACGRRHYISALEDGYDGRVSCLNISETDAIIGRYDEIIGDNIEVLLSSLTPSPKCLLIYFNCIDDFIGTDETALMLYLTERFAGFPIVCCRIDPVAMDQPVMPGMKIQSRQFSLIKRVENQDKGVNLIGAHRPISESSELFTMLKKMGAYPIRQLSSCKSFKDYLDMGRSRLNISLSPMTKLAVEDMFESTGIPYFHRQLSIIPEEIERFYCELSDRLNVPVMDFSDVLNDIKKHLSKAAKILRNKQVIIDGTVGVNPIELTRMLLENEICVSRVMLARVRDNDKNNYDWIKYNHPETRIERANTYSILNNTLENDDDSIVIGYGAAYTLKAKHWVDLDPSVDDLMGFSGVRLILDKIINASQTVFVPAEEIITR